MAVQSSGIALRHQEVKENVELRAMALSIENMLSHFLEKKIHISQPVLSVIPHEHLYLGFCTIKSTFIPIPILYFSDIKMGMFATGMGIDTDCFRFALIELSPLNKTH